MGGESKHRTSVPSTWTVENEEGPPNRPHAHAGAPSVPSDGEGRPGLVVRADALDHRRGRLVHANEVDSNAVVAELQNHPVEGVDGRDVPEVRRL